VNGRGRHWRCVLFALVVSCLFLSCARFSLGTRACCTDVSTIQVLEGESEVTGIEHGEALVWPRFDNKSIGVSVADREGQTQYYYSSDGGLIWRPDEGIRELYQVRTAPGRVGVAPWEPPNLAHPEVKYRTLYDRTGVLQQYHERSTDGGKTWTRMKLLLADCEAPVRIFHGDYHPHDPLTIYLQGDIPGARHRFGMFMSTDGGDNLTFLYETSLGGQLSICRAHPNIMYGKGISESLIKSMDGGKSWDLVGQNDEIRKTLVRLHKNRDPAQGQEILEWRTGISDIQADPSDCSRVYVATTKGLLRSEDGGKSWCVLNTGITYAQGVRSIEVVPDSPNILLLGTDRGLMRSTDRGCHWEKIDVLSHIAK
jgi:hypothetical protein